MGLSHKNAMLIQTGRGVALQLQGRVVAGRQKCLGSAPVTHAAALPTYCSPSSVFLSGQTKQNVFSYITTSTTFHAHSRSTCRCQEGGAPCMESARQLNVAVVSRCRAARRSRQRERLTERNPRWQAQAASGRWEWSRRAARAAEQHRWRGGVGRRVSSEGAAASREGL